MPDTPNKPDQSADSDQSIEKIADLPEQVVSDDDAKAIKGGATADGSLDAGIHFKYDLKAQKEG